METHRQRSPLWPPVLLSTIVVGSAPFLGVVQKRLRDPGSGDERLLTAVFAIGLAVLLATLVAALVRLARRDGGRRLGWRLACVGAAAGLAALQILRWNREVASVNAVERFHYLSFGLIGVLFFRFFRERRDLSVVPLTLIATAMVAVVDESIQHLVAVRTGEGLDIALNLYAGLCGLLVAVALSPSWEWLRRPTAGSARWLGAGLALLTLALGAFVDRAHLGHDICDPGLDACFRSAYAQKRLVRLAEERASRWRTDPPRRSGPLDLEDHYRTEGMWHLLYRQAALERGDVEAARGEAAILVEYFQPYLEVTSPDLLESAGSESPRPTYVSPVFRSYARRRFATPVRPAFWGLVGVAALLCASAWWWGPRLLGE